VSTAADELRPLRRHAAVVDDRTPQALGRVAGWWRVPIDERVLYPFVVFCGLILGLVVGRWWTLAAAVGLGLLIAITTEVDEVSPWFLGSAYGALAAAGIAVGVVIRQRLRV
jgi:predicted membrane protein